MKNIQFRELFQAFLATFIIGACISYFFIITLRLFPDIDTDGVRQVLPIFNTTFSLMVGFYFGSTVTSRAKDETIKSLTQNDPGGGTK